jgi:hypothetical protein
VVEGDQKSMTQWGFAVDRDSLKNHAKFIESNIKYKNGERTSFNIAVHRRRLNERYPHTRTIIDETLGAGNGGSMHGGRSTAHEESMIRNLQSIRQLLELIAEHLVQGPRAEVQEALRTLYSADSSIVDGGDEDGNASNDDSDYEHEEDDDNAMIQADESSYEEKYNSVSNGHNVIDASPTVEPILRVASVPPHRQSLSTSSASSPTSSVSSTTSSKRSSLAAENAKKVAIKAAAEATAKTAAAKAKAANPKSAAPQISGDGRSLVLADPAKRKTTTVTSKNKRIKRSRGGERAESDDE